MFKYIVPTFFLSHILVASAALTNPVGGATTMDTIPQFLQAALEVVVRVGAIVLVFMIIYSGYLFVTAQGNMEQVKKAKHTITWAILGGALLLGAWALAVGIGATVDALA